MCLAAAKYGNISFVNSKCRLKLPVLSALINFFRISTVAIYCNQSFAVLLVAMDIISFCSNSCAFSVASVSTFYLHSIYNILSTSDHYQSLWFTKHIWNEWFWILWPQGCCILNQHSIPNSAVSKQQYISTMYFYF